MSVTDSPIDNSIPFQDLLATCNSISFSDAYYGQCLLIDNNRARCVVSLFGAQVLSFVPKHDERERLWLSPKAVFDGKTPIRGGIPICWPWFSAHPEQGNKQNINFPSHGYARSQYWQLVECEEDPEAGYTKLILQPSQMFMYDNNQLSCKLVIEVGNQLNVSLIATNTGDEAVAFSQALHTYFSVTDITQTEIVGLANKYWDKLDNKFDKSCPKPYTINQEVDRIHACDALANNSLQSLSIVDIAAKTTTIAQQSGHDSIVVWNPWKEKSASMRDMQDDSYRYMLCIEAANTVKAATPLVLEAKQTHKLTQTIA